MSFKKDPPCQPRVGFLFLPVFCVAEFHVCGEAMDGYWYYFIEVKDEFVLRDAKYFEFLVACELGF